MDFESRFWQVLLHKQSRDKTAFFVSGGQKRWTVMPMGCLNAHGTFCCLVDTLKRQWNRQATAIGNRDDIEVTLKGEQPWTDAEVIVDDIMLHSEKPEPPIKYFEVVLQTLQKYQVTVKLKNFEVHEPNIMENNDIRDMKRPQTPQHNPNEARIAAFSQRKGQDDSTTVGHHMDPMLWQRTPRTAQRHHKSVVRKSVCREKHKE
jgi:Reverse transcriptase (RNA-dependent DNA polymerase)